MLLVYSTLGYIALNLIVSLGIWVHFYIVHRHWMWQDFSYDPWVTLFCHGGLYLIILKRVAVFPVYLFLVLGRCCLSGWSRGWAYYHRLQPTRLIQTF